MKAAAFSTSAGRRSARPSAGVARNPTAQALLEGGALSPPRPATRLAHGRRVRNVIDPAACHPPAPTARRPPSPAGTWAAGRGCDVLYGFASSPFGRFIIGWDARGILQLSFVDPGEAGARFSELRKRAPQARMRRDDAAVRRLATRIFAWGGARGEFPVFLRGTYFQVRVWRELLKIPPGATITYGELAAAAGSPGAARAVGTAMAANPIAVLVPCHRVVREGGGLGGYRWGVSRKRALLDWESGRATSKAHQWGLR